MKQMSLILVLAIILTTLSMPFVEAAGTHDPYLALEMVKFDEIVNKAANTTADDRGFVRNITAGKHILFRAVDFGEFGPVGVDIYAASEGTSAGGEVVIRIDDPKSEPIARVTTEGAGWANAVRLYTDITKRFTGVHDVYVSNEGGVSNLFRAVFVEGEEVSSGAVAYVGDVEFDDIKGNPYEYSIYTLWNLGILEGFAEGVYEPEIGVSRADFSKILFRVLNNGEHKSTEQIYSDVPKDDEAFDAVGFLNSRGVISMPEDKKFNPYSFIKTVDAVVMTVRALGYEPLAKLRGGYPTGYMTIAVEEGLLRGLKIDEHLRRDTMAVLVENMLDADYLDIKSISSDGTVDYEKTAGILELTRGIYRGKGIISANSCTQLNIPDSSVENGEVVINGKTYLVGDTAAELLLGYDVNYFYTVDKEADKRTIICVRPQNGLDIDVYDTAENAEGVDINEQGISCGIVGGRDKAVSFSGTTRFIYNGVAIDGLLSDAMGGNEFRGRITHIKHSNADDVVLIEHYTNVVVESVDTLKNVVKDKLSGKVFNFDSKDNNVLILKDGERSSFRSIVTGSVLTVYASNSSSKRGFIKAIIESGVVSGTVTMVKKETVIIDNQGYKISPDCRDTIFAGMTGNFVINSFGEIVTIDYTAKEGAQVGIILDYAEESEPFEDYLRIKVFNKDEQTVILPLKQTVTMDGVVCKTVHEVVNGKGLYRGLKNVNMQTLIHYNVNSSGEINMIDTYLIGAENSNDVLKRLTSGVESMNFVRDNSMIVRSTGAGAFPYDTDPEFFIFWEANNPDTLIYNSKFEIGGDIGSETIFNGDIYSLDSKNPYAEYVVWQGRGDISKWKPVKIFNEISYSIDENGNYGYTVNLKSSTGEEDYFVSEESLGENIALKAILDTVVKGDAVRFKLNQKGHIVSGQVMFFHDGSEMRNGVSAAVSKSLGIGSGADRYQYLRTLYGKVVAKFGKFIELEYLDASGNAVREYCYVDGNVAKCDYTDTTRPALEVSIPGDNIEVGSKVAVFTANAVTQQVVIYVHQNL